MNLSFNVEVGFLIHVEVEVVIIDASAFNLVEELFLFWPSSRITFFPLSVTLSQFARSSALNFFQAASDIQTICVVALGAGLGLKADWNTSSVEDIMSSIGVSMS